MLIVALFAGVNGSMYVVVTGRCANNYGSASQVKAIDVEKYLPFDDALEIVIV